MPGFGLMPFGTGPMGLGTPVTASLPPNGPAGSRYINPATKDYERNPSTRQLKQMPKVRQQVLLALTTILGSASTLDGFGIRLPRKQGDRFQSQMENSVRAALRHLTSVERVIQIESIKVESGRGGRARITVSWSELATNQRDRLTV